MKDLLFCNKIEPNGSMILLRNDIANAIILCYRKSNGSILYHYERK